jgi:hypothetical protein
MKSVFNNKVVNKDELKLKIDNEITRRKKTQKINNKLIPILTSMVLIIGISVIILFNNQENSLNNKPDNKPDGEKPVIVVTKNMKKSANYNIEIAKNMTSYITENYNLENIINGGSLEIEASKIVSSDEFSNCDGKITIAKGFNNEYTYKVASSCGKEEGQDLVIKKYENMNNIHLGQLLDLKITEDGYIAIFAYLKDIAERTCGKREIVPGNIIEECNFKYDSIAFVKIDEEGILKEPVVYDKTHAGLSSSDKLNIENGFDNIYSAEDGYYLRGTIDGDNGWGITVVIKLDKSGKELWTKTYPRSIMTTQNAKILGDTIALYGIDKKMYILNPKNGELEKTLSFEIEAGIYLDDLVELEYSDEYYYYYAYCTKIGNNNMLYKFDKDGNKVYGKDLSATQKLFEKDDYESCHYQELKVTTNKVIINNQEEIKIYDLEGNYINNYEYESKNYTKQFEVLTNNKKETYTFITEQNNFYFIETFDSKNKKIKSGNYGLEFETNEFDHTKYHLGEEEIIKTIYSLNNGGSLYLLLFK